MGRSHLEAVLAALEYARTLGRRMLEIRRLHDVAETERDRLIVRLLAETGMRVGELCALTAADIEQVDDRTFLRVQGKGRSLRLLPVAPDLARRLQRERRRQEPRGRPQPLFVSELSLSSTDLNPQWLDSTHIAYTADESGSKPFGIVMKVDLTTGRFAPMRASQIPGGPEFPNFNGSRSPSLAQAGVMQPLLINSRFAAYQRFDYSSGCSATSDLVRGFGDRKRLMTFTRKMHETPLDLTADGRVLALREWISSGRHNGLCTYGGTNTLRQEVIAVARPHHVEVVLRFAPVVLRGNASAPAIDAAWSPDREHFAYIARGGNLILRSLIDGSQRIVADHVEALDW